MKGTKNLTLLVIGGIILILFFWGCSGYNGLVKQDETVKNTWANVQSAYQRRADLIPNLVATVKGAADFEKETYVQVALARAGQLKQALNVSSDSLTPQKLQQIQQASKEAMDAARMAINIAVERYPDLKATNNFTDLQRQLEGTENRINTARNDFNNSVNTFNTKVRSFPVNLIAGMMGFKAKDPFAADAGAEKAPEVKF
jgi:LemA protein